MPSESSQFNPHERLPFGAKPPDTEEFKAAAAEYNRKMEANAEARQKQDEMKQVHIIPPEKTAEIRAAAEAKLEEQRRIIRETKN
jgi:hypothetical protein